MRLQPGVLNNPGEYPGVAASRAEHQGDNAIMRSLQNSERAHLFRFYPLLLEIAFLKGYTPSIWLFPDEHAKLYDRETVDKTEPMVNGDEHMIARHAAGGVEEQDEDEIMDAGDGGDLIQVTAKDLARRCLDIIGMEMGIKA